MRVHLKSPSIDSFGVSSSKKWNAVRFTRMPPSPRDPTNIITNERNLSDVYLPLDQTLENAQLSVKFMFTFN